MTDKIYIQSNGTTYKMEVQTVEAPCQNCGKLVLIHVPFIGCVFCSDCVGGRTVAYMMKEANEVELKFDAEKIDKETIEIIKKF